MCRTDGDESSPGSGRVVDVPISGRGSMTSPSILGIQSHFLLNSDSDYRQRLFAGLPFDTPRHSLLCLSPLREKASSSAPQAGSSMEFNLM